MTLLLFRGSFENLEVYRPFGAWRQLVVSMNRTLAGSSNRMKLMIHNAAAAAQLW
jgi:hypothetical protein